MALADDPSEHILHMFKMEIRSRSDHQCTIYPQGSVPEGIPLDDDELVYGVYGDRFFFTPRSLMWSENGTIHKLYWRSIRSCSTEHGSGDKISRVLLVDGTIKTVPIDQFSEGWAGRIGQLYHAMIARWRVQEPDPHFLLTVERFFDLANRDDAIAPNWYPEHPGLAWMRERLLKLQRVPSIEGIYLVVTDYAEGFPCVQEVLILSRKSLDEALVHDLHFDYIGPSSDRTKRLMGTANGDVQLISGVWD